MATAQFPKTQTSSNSGEKQHKGSCAALLRGADTWQDYSMQVLLLLGLRGDPLVLQTFPPGKLTSLEFNMIKENEPLGLFEPLPTPGFDYTMVSNQQLPVGDHESRGSINCRHTFG